VNGDIETNGVFENGEFKTKNYYYDISQLNFENTIDYNELKESKVDSCFYFTRNARNYKFTGLAINEMGKLKTEFNFREGKLHGKNFVYHRKQKTLECNYINGKMHGENLSWCIDGHLQHKTLYDNGIQINEGFWWYCDGKTKIHQIFKNGEKISEKSYYPNGILRSEEDNNSNQHTYIEYYESGNIKSKSVSSFDNSQTQCWDEHGSEVQCPE
jgi:antitoxin component YwqK of YwqJK toxin-antitoxin module